MLNTKNTALIIVDIQGKLANLMHEKEFLFKNAQNLIKGMQILNIPILLAEQNPKGLGATIPEVTTLLQDIKPVSKMSFSCCQNEDFMKALDALQRKQIILICIETHICVYQTAVDLIEKGYEVGVATDAVSSRTIANKEIGLQKIKDQGASLTSVETALFELLKTAEHGCFKEIAKIIK